MNDKQSHAVLYCRRCSFRVINCHMCRVCGSTSFFQAETSDVRPEPDYTDPTTLTGGNSGLSVIVACFQQLWETTVEEWLSVQSKIRAAFQQGASLGDLLKNEKQQPEREPIPSSATRDLVRTGLNQSLRRKLER